MTEAEMKNLGVGDIVRPRGMNAQTFVVTANYGRRVTAVRTADITNAPEWELVSKAKQKLTGR